MGAHTFISEVQILRRVRHAHIVLFQGALVLHNRLCIVMEWVEGCTLLDAKLQGNEKRLLRDAACGLQYLHAQRPPILHRDVKPENILCEVFDGVVVRAKICDFGLSSISKNLQSWAGTMRWMAPE